ncbi:hypothetical protein TYRP_014068 [Tyrophagus putrescentiae]|nr:hypothetical protein TYRP_014068 [Tyrophagus putrescentiae]
MVFTCYVQGPVSAGTERFTFLFTLQVNL